jgi:hypothetical protein
MDDDDLVPFLGEAQDAARGVSGHGSSDLDDQSHDRYSALIRT